LYGVWEEVMIKRYIVKVREEKHYNVLVQAASEEDAQGNAKDRVANGDLEPVASMTLVTQSPQLISETKL